MAELVVELVAVWKQQSPGQTLLSPQQGKTKPGRTLLNPQRRQAKAGRTLKSPQWRQVKAGWTLLSPQLTQGTAGWALLSLQRKLEQSHPVWKPLVEQNQMMRRPLVVTKLAGAAQGTQPAQDAAAGAVQCTECA